jgi:hypothetical protein
MKIMNRLRWLFTFALLLIVTLPSSAFAQSALGLPTRCVSFI